MARVLTVRSERHEEMDAHVEPAGEGLVHVELEGPRGVRGSRLFVDVPDAELIVAIEAWIEETWTPSDP